LAARTAAGVILLVGLAGLGAPGALSAQGIGVELREDAVEVASLPTGTEAVLFSAERRPAGFSSRLITLIRTAVDEDRDGRIVFPLEEAPAAASLWLVIDLRTGRFGAASPVEEAPVAFDPPVGRAIDPETGSEFVAADGHASLDLFLVRPDSGIWRVQAVDGGTSEASGLVDGRILLRDPQWEPVLGSTEPPGSLLATDLLIAVDPAELALDANLVGGLDELP